MIRLTLTAALIATAWSARADAQPMQVVQPIASADAGLPSDFQGKVRYFGNHSGEIATRLRAGERRSPRADCPRPDQGCPELVGGSLEVELEFDGDVVKGVFRGTGGLHDSGLIGRRQGAQCRLFDLTDGSVWSGRCDGEAFVGSVASVAGAARQIELRFETVGTRTIDFAERERRRREIIERQRRIEQLRGQIDSSAPIEKRFAAAVELDSYGWRDDRYVPGSLTDIERTRERDNRFEISGAVALEGGGTGWIRARVENDAILCIESWDAPGMCRPIRTPLPLELPDDAPADAPLLLTQPGAAPTPPR